jgi:GT2 family glycosyltransferase
MEANETVTIGVVNYNGRETVIKAIDSIKSAASTNIDRIIIADNNSTDGSPETIENMYPEVLVLHLGKNFGLPYARQKILEQAHTDLVFIIDNDITLTPGCLQKLVSVKRKVHEAGVIHPHILDEDEPDRPQPYNGGWIHYLCAFIPGEHPDLRAEYEVFDTVSGAALLVDRKIAGKTGGFDSDYFFNWEDGDFTFRLSVTGYPCLNVPGAIVYHKSKPRGKSKVFYQVRNRWYFIFKIYSYKTLFVCLSAFVLYEFSLAGLMLLKKTFIEYLRGNISAVLDAPRTLRKRKKVQALKTKKDSEVLKADDMYVPDSMLGGALAEKAKKLYIEIFRLYWEGVKDFL